ncbi:MAG: hypothetical protein D6795_06775 [Deltaproteobacteria bacterium]|nr:MAG: hypothetical protein D6795_06775 [Deltaproteobacteria bacterium]
MAGILLPQTAAVWERRRRASPEVEKSPALHGTGEGAPTRPRPYRIARGAGTSGVSDPAFLRISVPPSGGRLVAHGGRSGNPHPIDTIESFHFPAALPLLPSSGGMLPGGGGRTPSDSPSTRFDGALRVRRFADGDIEM